MVRINNYLFGDNVRLPFKELFVCSSLYGKQFIRRYLDLPIDTPLTFRSNNPGWRRAVEEWQALPPDTRALYQALVFDEMSSVFYLWILDNLKNPVSYSEMSPPPFCFTLTAEYEPEEGIDSVKIFFQDLLRAIPDLSQFSYTMILKKAGANPDYCREDILDIIPFNVEISKVGARWKIRQDLLRDFDVLPGVSYHYQIFHYNYILNQSVYSNICVETIPS